jgi:glycosyltransferase involved in cell wall biosynthesis
MPSGNTLGRHTVLIVENNTVPFDRRVWREACALRDAGWVVSVVCPRLPDNGGVIPPAHEILDGVAVRRFPLTEAAGGPLDFVREYARAYVEVRRELQHIDADGAVDVIHVANPPDIFFPLLAHWRERGCRVVFDHHDLFPESCADRFHGLVGAAIVAAAQWCEHRSMQVADVVISTNESYADLARKRGGIPADRVFVVRNGPDTRRFRPLPPEPQLRRGRRYLAVYLGVMGPQDGMRGLMQAIRHFVHGMGRNDTQFLLIGDGSERPWMQRVARDWEVSNVVEFTGLLHDDQRIVTALSSADVCLAPEPSTPFTERSTIVKVAEYMACGRPLVAYDLRETRVTAAGAAYYVPSGRADDYAHAIAVLLDDPERREVMGREGLARVADELSWERQVPRLLQAYARATS